jgi:acetylornithine deacetylase/succinyl-diaminopimelate desuccinylase-like protein
MSDRAVPDTVQRALEHFAKSRDLHMQDLHQLVRIPSVSFDGFPPEEVRRSGEAAARLLEARGFENVRLLELPGVHPYVYGDFCHAPGKPTLLLYAHHDVQPAGDAGLWKTPPFEPVEINGRLYGRGSADDKAGIVVHTAALASYLGAGLTPPLNLKILVEGEEEIGSGHLDEFLQLHNELLRADVMVLTDTANFDVGVPSVTTSLRGVCGIDIEVRSLKQSVHSGLWGGALPDAGMGLAMVLASLVDSDGRVRIPGFYDKVRPLTEFEQQSIDALPCTEAQFREQAGLLPGVPILPPAQGSPFATIWRQPALAVSAIEVSTRKDARNIINGSAWARIGVRIAPDMDPKETERLLLDYITAQRPLGCEVSAHSDGATTPWGCASDHPAFQAAFRSLERGYGRRALAIGCGASIPFVGPLSQRLGNVPALLIGVEDPYTNAHSENESLSIADWEGAVRSAIHLYDDIARNV